MIVHRVRRIHQMARPIRRRKMTSSSSLDATGDRHGTGPAAGHGTAVHGWSPLTAAGAVVAAAVAVAVLVLTPTPVWAHVNGELTASADNLSTVSLTWEHGCAGSPTTEVRTQIPGGATDVSAQSPDGWSAVVEPDQIVWSGPGIRDGQKTTVTATMRLVEPGGERVFLPTVQTCETGEEAWIERYTAEQAEPPKPAPLIIVGQLGAPAVGAHSHGPNVLVVVAIVAVAVAAIGGVTALVLRRRSGS